MRHKYSTTKCNNTGDSLQCGLPCSNSFFLFCFFLFFLFFLFFRFFFRLLPLIATVFGFHFTGKMMHEIYAQFQRGVANKVCPYSPSSFPHFTLTLTHAHSHIHTYTQHHTLTLTVIFTLTLALNHPHTHIYTLHPHSHAHSPSHTYSTHVGATGM